MQLDEGPNNGKILAMKSFSESIDLLALDLVLHEKIARIKL